MLYSTFYTLFSSEVNVVILPFVVEDAGLVVEVVVKVVVEGCAVVKVGGAVDVGFGELTT